MKSTIQNTGAGQLRTSFFDPLRLLVGISNLIILDGAGFHGLSELGLCDAAHSWSEHPLSKLLFYFSLLWHSLGLLNLIDYQSVQFYSLCFKTGHGHRPQNGWLCRAWARNGFVGPFDFSLRRSWGGLEVPRRCSEMHCELFQTF